MQHHDGSPAKLGDIVVVRLHEAVERARIVMLGDTREHLGLDQRFLDWVNREGLLGSSQVIVEWIGRNPLAHDNPSLAPAGNYLFTGLDSCVMPANHSSSRR
ncbi:MAG: hypothetical protein K1X78_18860 [Verrucomicrobiaceae bacterium]|nr:hypothetical protein [Verrucomicrobiaceae bacterium]